MSVASAVNAATRDPSRLIKLPPSDATPLLTPALASAGDAVVTVADPFPVYHDDRLYVLAEIEGTRADGTYFKKIGVFQVDGQLGGADYLGETWPEPDGEYSFPYVVRDGRRFLMIPDVSLPGRPADKVFRIYECDESRFPFGWTLLHEGGLPGAVSPSDKVLLRREDVWYLFVSDIPGGGRLLLYSSRDLRTWNAHPRSPVLRRRSWDRLLNRFVSPRLYGVRPWRLGGGVVVVDGSPLLFMQHMGRKRVYGEAVTPLMLDHLDVASIRFHWGSRPVLAASESVPWGQVSAHHVAFARTRDSHIVATDGFDGEIWCSTVQRYDPPCATEFDSCGAAVH